MNDDMKKRVIFRNMDQESLEWLSRSLIRESLKPMTINLLSLRLMNKWHSIVKVRDLGPYKTIVTFEIIKQG